MKLQSEKKGKLQIGRLNATGNIDGAEAGEILTALLSLYSPPVPKEWPINFNFLFLWEEAQVNTVS